MSPRPAPDLDRRRRDITAAVRTVAAAEGWSAVTMRRIASDLGVTQPVLYSAYASRQALVDAVALDGFTELAVALESADASPAGRMRAYLDFAEANTEVYEAMFTLTSGLAFAAVDAPGPLTRAFAGLRAVFPDEDGTRAEVAWAVLHGLATLGAGGRLAAGGERMRFDAAHSLLLPPPPAA